jgi:5-methylcytosine-specific restriction endonuclease McrBC GTP-binding regulatory subunit McrB
MNTGNALPVIDAGKMEAIPYGSRGHLNPHVVILDEISRAATQVYFYESILAQAPSPDSLLEEYRPWNNLWMKERDRLTRVAAEAIKLGLSERLVRLEEQRAEMVARVLMATLDELGLPPELAAKAPGILRRQLLAIGSGDQQ